MTDFACWRCMKREVDTPGMECDTCIDASLLPIDEPYKATSETAHRDHRASYDDRSGEMDRMAFQRWSDGR